MHMGVTLYKAVWSSLGVREMYGSECVALLIFVEAIVCLFGVVLQRSLLVLLQTRIEAEVQFDALSSDYKVSKSLLSATCDAEVSLGHSLEILGENDRLSAILMARSSSLTSLDGRPFLNYVAESDKQRVEKFLCEGNSEGLRCAPVGTMPARMIHADLCDVLGQQFSVVILHVRTFAEVGECQHLLGIQDRDSCRRHVLPSSSPWLLQNVAFHHDEDNVKSKVSLSCTSGSAAVDDLDAIEHVMVEFDCGHPSLPIQSITVRFSEDHTAVSSLSDWFIPSARSRFEIAIEKHIASSSILPRPHLGGLWLSPPKLSPFGFSRMLSCDAEFVHNIRKEVSPEKLHKFYGVSGRTVAVIFSQFQPMDKRAPMGESVRSVHAPKGETSGGLHQEPPFEVRTHIHLQVRTYGRRTMDVQIKRTTRFRKLFKLCSEHFNFPCDQVMLAVNGEHIDLDDCAEKLDLQDGDIIQMLQRLSDTDRMGYSHCVELSRLEM